MAAGVSVFLVLPRRLLYVNGQQNSSEPEFLEEEVGSCLFLASTFWSYVSKRAAKLLFNSSKEMSYCYISELIDGKMGAF